MIDVTSAIERLDRLEAENRELRSQIEDLRAEIATEVRTRRLVVEGADGFERIVGEADGPEPGLTVHAPPAAGRTGASFVRLFADRDDLSDAWEQAGVYLSAGGYGIASLGFADWDGSGVYHTSLWLNRPGRRPMEAGIELSSAGLHKTDLAAVAS